MTSQPPHFDSTFPTVPASLSTDGHGMRDHFAEQEHTAQRPSTHTLQDITPYLGLRDRLSLVLINRWTILLLLILVRVLIAIGSLRHDLDAAKVKAMSACSSVEATGSAMASMPHFMAQGTNELAAHGVEKTVNGLESTLLMTVTAMEEIFVFVINMMYGTYECLITLAVGTAGHATIALAEDATKSLNESLTSIVDELSKGAEDFDNTINTFVSSFTSLLSHKEPPKINLEGPTEKLKNLKIPTTVTDELEKLNKSIPNFAQVHNATDTVLKMPFELIKKELRQHLGTFTFNKTALPVPAKKQLTFCSDEDGISKFFDGLYDVADVARKVFIAVIVLAAIAVMVPMAYREIRRWRVMQDRAALVNQNGLDPMDVIYIASRPHSASAGLKASRVFSAEKKQVLVRWFFAYVTAENMMFVLSLAVAGLVGCLFQWIILEKIRKDVPALANEVAGFTGKVVGALNAASLEWSNGTNDAIVSKQNEINNNMLGWVNTSTTAVNDTLNSFVDETTKLLQDTFGGTILYEPIKGTFDCLIGLKVEKLQEGLTWAHDHAHVDFPLFPNDTFSAGADKALASSGDSADANVVDPGAGVTDRITGAVNDLVNTFENGIKQEAAISAAILAVFFLFALGALVHAFICLIRREKNRAEGGVSYAGDIHPANVTAGSRSITPNLAGQGNGADGAPPYNRFDAFRSPMPNGSVRNNPFHDPARNGKEQQWNVDAPSAYQHTGQTEWPSEKAGHSEYGVIGEMR